MLIKKNFLILLMLMISSLSYGQFQSSEDEVPGFDIYNVDSNIALAEIEKQKNNLTEAIFALERALAIDPSRIDARYMLAEIHILLNEKDSAKQQLALVIASGGELAESANALLMDINYIRKGKSSFLAGYRLSVDTNINSGIDDTTVFIPVSNSNLDFSNNLSKNRQSIHTVFGSALYRYIYTESLSFFTSTTLIKSSDDLYNQRLFYITSGADKNVGNMTYTPKLSFYRTEYDNYDKVNNAQLSFNANQQIDQKNSVGLQVELLKTDYSIQSIRDDVRLKFSGHYKWQPSSKIASIFELSANSDMKKKQSYLGLDYQTRQADMSVKIKLMPKWILNSGLSYAQKEYYGQDSVFLKTRRDTRKSWHTKLSWSLRSSTSINLAHRYIRNNSNIAIYDFSKNIFSIDIVERF